MDRIHLYDEIVASKINKANKALWYDYKLQLVTEGRSKNTIYQYMSDIREFYCWLYVHANNTFVLKCHKKVFERFFLSYIQNHTSHSRINRLQSSLRNLLEFAVDDDDEYADYQINVMRKIKGLGKQPRRKIYFLSDNEITLLLKYLVKHHKYQQALYISLSYDSMGRRNEVLQVNKTNFLHRKLTNVVVGKRGKKFRLMYFSRTRHIARLYFKQRGHDHVKSLWVTYERGRREAASYQELYYWVQSLRKIFYKLTGKWVPFTPHSFRHSAIQNYHNGTHLFCKKHHKHGMKLSILQLGAHHSNIATTQSYLKDNSKQKLASAFDLSPSPA